MSDIYVNGSNDIVFVSGDLAFTSDYGYGETVVSRLRSFLRTFLGEWFLDNATAPIWGMPYYQSIFTDRRPSDLEIDVIFRSAILNTEGISRLNQLTIESNTSSRSIQITFIAETDSGSLIEDIIEINLGA